jgi:hypothetical protein
LASEDEVQLVAHVIARWCREVAPQITPSQAKKKARTKESASTSVTGNTKRKKPIPQPSFSPHTSRVAAPASASTTIVSQPGKSLFFVQDVI